MAKYIVDQGDCIESIAFDNGFFWETIWNNSQNAELKQKRQDPDVLFPGDDVFIPDKQEKTESGATEQKHRFRRKGVPAKLHLRILERSEQETTEPQEAHDSSDDLHAVYEEPESRPEQEVPRAHVPYVLKVEGRIINDETDSEGWIRQSIPPNAKTATLILEPGTPKESVLTLRLGHLNPADSVSGAKQRLNNLGFSCNEDSDELSADFQNALAEFQEKHGLNVTTELDQTTVDKLIEVHGS